MALYIYTHTHIPRPSKYTPKTGKGLRLKGKPHFLWVQTEGLGTHTHVYIYNMYIYISQNFPFDPHEKKHGFRQPKTLPWWSCAKPSLRWKHQGAEFFLGSWWVRSSLDLRWFHEKNVLIQWWFNGIKCWFNGDSMRFNIVNGIDSFYSEFMRSTSIPVNRQPRMNHPWLSDKLSHDQQPRDE